MDAASSPVSGDGEWEICNDRGFIYKRRRRLRLRQPAQEETGTTSAGDAEAEQRRRRRDLRRRCLLHLRDLFMRELELLHPLSSGVVDLTPAMSTEAAPEAPAVAAAEPPPPPPDPGEDIRKPLVDSLLSQVAIQEAILRKLSDSCDYVESLCREKEERLLESLMELPIWGSPRSLLLSLSE